MKNKIQITSEKDVDQPQLNMFYFNERNLPGSIDAPTDKNYQLN